MKRLFDWLQRSAGWPIGVLALAAWLALLYFMVGDVLQRSSVTKLS